MNRIIKSTNSFLKNEIRLYIRHMIRVVLLGGGNVASHLAKAFFDCPNIDLVQIYNRTLSTIVDKQSLAPLTDSLEHLVTADIYVIATSDIAIEGISKMTQHIDGLVVHTSGTTELNALSNKRTGVFYPLQSFTKGAEIDFSKIPLCLETKNIEDYNLLETLAKSLSDKVYPMSSTQRKKLHIAAVFVNNFVNYMYRIGEDICKENEIPFEVLYPLIEETAKKIQYLSPKQAQTGPAARNDKKTVALHKQDLDSSQKEIYQLLTEAILNKK